MGPRIARSIAAVCAAAATAAAAQAVAPQTVTPQGTTALPPQNYGARPGFFRGASEMAAFQSGNVAAAPAAAPPEVVASPQAAAPTVTAPNSNVAVTVAAPLARVPDPTQNLQWAERQMDRSERAAAEQAATTAARTPRPIAPGAYNGQTDPALR